MGEVYTLTSRKDGSKRILKIDELTGIEIGSFVSTSKNVFAMEKTSSELLGLSKGSRAKESDEKKEDDEGCDDKNPCATSIESTRRDLVEATRPIHGLRKIFCGKDHYLALSTNGALYSWGSNRYGQLGLGHHDDIDSATIVVGALQAKDIADVRCGTSHTMVLTEAGDLYSFGRGDLGQHGHGTFRPQLCPHVIGSFVKRGPVVSVACGANFTVCCTVSGNLWSWGEGQSGQLGLGDYKKRSSPTLVSIGSGSRKYRVTSVAAGWGHAGALSDAGEVFMWGLNVFGQLGLGDTRTRSNPSHLPNSGSSAFRVREVGCNGHFTAAVTDGGALYTWGSLDGDSDTVCKKKTTSTADSLSDVDSTLARLQKAPIFGALHRRVAKRLFVNAHGSTSPKTLKPARVERLAGLNVSSIVCGGGIVVACAMPHLRSISTTCGPLYGGTPITLHGSAFWMSDNVSVSFALEDCDQTFVVPGIFDAKSGTISCITPAISANVIERSVGGNVPETATTTTTGACVRARVDVVFGEGSQTTQGLSFVFYPQFTTTYVEPCYGPSRGGVQVAIFGDGFIDFGCAVARFSVGDKSVVVPATFVPSVSAADEEGEEESGGGARFECTLPSIPVEAYPASAGVSIALNGIDFMEAGGRGGDDDDGGDDGGVASKHNLDMDENEGRGERIALFNDVVQRCVPESVELRGEATMLWLKGIGFPRALDHEFDVTVKISCKGREWNVKGCVDSATKISCAMPKLRARDVFATLKHTSATNGEECDAIDRTTGSLLAQVSLTFTGSNFCEPVPLYLYSGHLESLSPPCGPLMGGSRLKIYSAGSWFFSSSSILVRFKGKKFNKTVKGTYDRDADVIYCDVPAVSDEVASVQVDVAMNGSRYVRGRNGRALTFSYYPSPVVESVRFAMVEMCPKSFAEAVGEDIVLTAAHLRDTSLVRVKFRRECDDGRVIERIVSPKEIDEDEGTIRVSLPPSLLDRDEAKEEMSENENGVGERTNAEKIVDDDVEGCGGGSVGNESTVGDENVEGPSVVSIAISLNGVDFSEYGAPREDSASDEGGEKLRVLSFSS